MRFLLALILIPAIEIALLIKVGQAVGVLSTLALLVLSAVIGIQLIRIQGFATLLNVQQRLHEGQMPAEDILGSMFLAVAGLLFVIPGFFTDIIGFFCLFPAVRRRFARHFMQQSHTTVHSHIFEGEFSREPARKLDAIDVEYTRDDNTKN